MELLGNTRCTPHKRTSKLTALGIALILTCLLSCNTPESIARFTSAAVATLESGDTLFDDMKASCVHEAQTREPFGTFAISDPSPAACDAIGRQAEGLKAASKLLSSYFTALNDLASFGNTKAGDHAKDLATKASGQAKLSAASQKALSSVADFLTGVATSAYQQKRLADAVVKAHGDIEAALDGLGEAVGVAYLRQLQDEEEKTASRYREFLLSHQGATDAMLALDSRWANARSSFAAKQKAAQSYQAALDTVSKGNEDLAAHARNLRARELPGLLSPYSAQLESMVQGIQKAFF